MSGLEGYTGPTSGRITLGGGGEVKRERFYDDPLTAEERRAVEWFTALSPHEQLREVRRLKWNLDEARKGREAALDRARAAEAENARLAAERDARRPEGFELPRAAGELLSLAALHGWRTARAWTLKDDGQSAWLAVLLGKEECRVKLTWGVPRDGDGRGALFGRGLLRQASGPWRDAPPLKRIKEIIREA